MKNGKTSTGSFLLGGSLFQPVGAGGTSSLGSSPNDMVNATLYQTDATLKPSRSTAIKLSFGKGFIDDQNNAFDRDLTWFFVQPRLNLTQHTYAVARYSEIGTYDSNRGYHFGGEFLAGGNDAFGYDAKRLQRISAGLGWKPNPRVSVKLEVGNDIYGVIDASPTDPSDDARKHAGIEVTMSF